ncbi:MAG: helix-turn-helix domain-containing protein, partial [Lactococcus lactis]|nr:helix-turn-helix domain-containing protein [Lactococcus lactis]
MERAFKGIWIPKEIWLDKDLNWVEKILLVEIDSLDNDEGCWASNGYFADFFNLSKNRISILISSLSKKGYISVD